MKKKSAARDAVRCSWRMDRRRAPGEGDDKATSPPTIGGDANSKFRTHMTAATHWYYMTRMAWYATARTRSHMHAPSSPAGARMAARDVPVLY
jgi:hypothetical protein